MHILSRVTDNTGHILQHSQVFLSQGPNKHIESVNIHVASTQDLGT